MTKQEKSQVVEQLKAKFNESQFFYVTDSSTLTVEEVNNLRRACHKSGIQLQVAKNTLVKKALEQADGDYEALYDVLSGPTSLMFTDVSNSPAKMIKDFRKSHEKPVLKAAYIDSDVFIGDDQLSVLSDLKSKEELIGEVIGLLQSPAKNVISALKSSGSTLSGILKTLSEKES